MENLHDEQTGVQSILPALNTLSVNSGRISLEERDRLFLALQSMDYEARRMHGTSLRFLEAAKEVGVTVSAADKARILKSMSDPSMAGPCVSDPTPAIERDTRSADWFPEQIRGWAGNRGTRGRMDIHKPRALARPARVPEGVRDHRRRAC